MVACQKLAFNELLDIVFVLDLTELFKIYFFFWTDPAWYYFLSLLWCVCVLSLSDFSSSLLKSLPLFLFTHFLNFVFFLLFLSLESSLEVVSLWVFSWGEYKTLWGGYGLTGEDWMGRTLWREYTLFGWNVWFRWTEMLRWSGNGESQNALSK